VEVTQVATEARKDDEGDYLFDALSECLEYVRSAYQQHEDQRPVMLFDIQEKRIYAYGYEGLKSELSATSQVSLAEQYEQAQRSGKMVVFVRDNEKRRLVSYSMDCE
jgi:hypothetical protein